MVKEPNAPDREAAFAASRSERDRTLQAVHSLESALGKAAGGEDWLAEVESSLRALQRAMSDEQHELNRPDALLAMIGSEHPRRFGSRIRSLREQYDDIIRQLASLRRQLDEPGETIGAVDLRHRAGAIIQALRSCRARQTDLVFEALELDLGARRHE